MYSAVEIVSNSNVTSSSNFRKIHCVRPKVTGKLDAYIVISQNSESASPIDLVEIELTSYYLIVYLTVNNNFDADSVNTLCWYYLSCVSVTIGCGSMSLCSLAKG